MYARYRVWADAENAIAAPFPQLLLFFILFFTSQITLTLGSYNFISWIQNN